MKGIIYNLLEQVVTEQHGEETWDKLLADADLEGAYTSLGSYPDEELLALVGAASAALDIPPDDIVRWFGRAALAKLAVRYPDFFAAHETTRPFLLTLNDIIHPEVRKLYPGADVPEFDFDDSSPDALSMGYQSARKLCSLAEGLIEGAADHFGETVSIDQTTCMKRGDEKCTLVISFDGQDRP
jgi:hypothetical protein